MNYLYRSYRRWNIDSIELIFFILLLLTSLTFVQVIHPYACLTVCLCLALSFIVYLKPMTGVYLFIVLYPLNSICLTFNYTPSQKIFVYFETIFSSVLLLIMIIRQLIEHHQHPVHNEPSGAFSHKFLIFLLALFIVWSVFTTFRSDYFIYSLFGWWRFITSFVIIAFLMLYLDSYDKFISVMIFYCFVSVIYALAAVCATYFAFEVKYELFQIFDNFIYINISLFNQSFGVVATNVGMITGVGLAAKHELAVLLSGGIFFAVFLIAIYNSWKIRGVLLILVMLFITIIYQINARISIIGICLVVLFLCLAISYWRKSIIWAVIVLLVFNLAGIFVFSLIQTTHKKNMETIVNIIEPTVSKSEFEPGSLSMRKSVWKRSAERILENRGLGSGPDSLMKDIAFNLPHSHNLLLTLATEYGLPGMALILLFLLVVTDSAYKSVFIDQKTKDNLWLLRAVFVAAVLVALLEYGLDLAISHKQLWFMLGLLMASINVAKKETNRNKLYQPAVL